MDSFHEPRRVSEPIKLEDLTSDVLAREAEYRAKGISLSGRVLHVCHYLPIAATLHSSSRPGIPSPPSTPPQQPSDIPPRSSEHPSSEPASHIPENPLQPKWSLSSRQGHAAMISGIRSLSTTHEQVIVGWIGDIETPNTTSGMSNILFPLLIDLTDQMSRFSLAGDRIKVPSTSLSEQDKVSLEEAISNFKSDDEDTKTTYVPLLLDDKVAHGHYDGYCKQSETSSQL
jgi:trehalose 6-phosphate synthase/phosphatase